MITVERPRVKSKRPTKDTSVVLGVRYIQQRTSPLLQSSRTKVAQIILPQVSSSLTQVSIGSFSEEWRSAELGA